MFHHRETLFGFNVDIMRLHIDLRATDIIKFVRLHLIPQGRSSGAEDDSDEALYQKVTSYIYGQNYLVCMK